MTDDNTGVLSNKAKIAYTESDTRMVEAKTGNLASQETIIADALKLRQESDDETTMLAQGTTPRRISRFLDGIAKSGRSSAASKS